MVCEFHPISDPLYHHTWSCLHHYNYQEALFTAERIFAENPNDEAIYLLATCFYRSNGPKQAKKFILSQGTQSPKCRYLLAKCYMDIGDGAEAETTLLGTAQQLDNPAEVVKFYKDIAPFVLRILAEIYKQTERRKLAINYLKKCLELNPLSWSAYTELIDLHDNVEPSEVFSLPKCVVLNNQSCLRALSNKINIGEIYHPNCPSKKRTDMHDSQEDLSVSRENVNPKCEEKFIDSVNSNDMIHSTEEQLSYSFNGFDPHVNSFEASEHICHGLLPECNNQKHSQTSKKIPVSKQLKKEVEHMETEPNKPLFGNAYIDPSQTMYGLVPVFNIKSTDSIENFQQSKYKLPVTIDNFSYNSKKNRSINTNKRILFNASKTTEFLTSSVNSKSEVITSTYVPLSYTSPSCKNEAPNASVISSLPISPLAYDQGKISDPYPSTRCFRTGSFPMGTKGPRTRLQFAKAAAAQKSSSKKEDVHSTGGCSNNKLLTESDSRLQSAIYYLQLLISMGRTYKFIKNYKLHDAVKQINELPKHHSQTALVCSWMAKAYLEMNDKTKACQILTSSFESEPWQLHGVVLLSATLWILNKEKELLYLAKDMLEMDRESVEVWCVFGNCMSLNKESEVASRYFQRVIQLNPSYAYGYLLLGHEYFTQDKLDAAMTSFRRALDVDSYDYRANYYIASVYQRQDNYIEAEKTLKETLKIFPDSYMLLTNLAVVRSKLKQNFSPDSVIELLERCCRLYPAEPLCRFHKASNLYLNGRYQEALVDLQYLEYIKEARVFLLMSLIYKETGDITRAMSYNRSAIELDPKCTNDSFMLDRNFCNGGVTSIGNIDQSCITQLNTNLSTSVRRNSESMQEDSSTTTSTTVAGASNNQINYDLSLLEAD